MLWTGVVQEPARQVSAAGEAASAGAAAQRRGEVWSSARLQAESAARQAALQQHDLVVGVLTSASRQSR